MDVAGPAPLALYTSQASKEGEAELLTLAVQQPVGGTAVIWLNTVIWAEG